MAELRRLPRGCRFAAAALLLICWPLAGPGSAAEADSRFFISPDGDRVELDLREVARRDVMARLFADSDIQWRDPSFAAETISGTFSGTRSDIARQLLANADFFVVYDRSVAGARMARLVIMGRAAAQSHPAPAALDLALQGLIGPPPPGTVAPALQPPRDGTVALPLTPAPGPAPALIPPAPEDRGLPLRPQL